MKSRRRKLPRAKLITVYEAVWSREREEFDSSKISEGYFFKADTAHTAATMAIKHCPGSGGSSARAIPHRALKVGNTLYLNPKEVIMIEQNNKSITKGSKAGDLIFYYPQKSFLKIINGHKQSKIIITDIGCFAVKQRNKLKINTKPPC